MLSSTLKLDANFSDELKIEKMTNMIIERRGEHCFPLNVTVQHEPLSSNVCLYTEK
jgi:hypothetical protein